MIPTVSQQLFRSLFAAVVCTLFITGCYSFSGNEGVYNTAWFETDLQGGTSTWPTVAQGSEFTIIIELWDSDDGLVYDVRSDDSSVQVLDVQTELRYVGSSMIMVARVEATVLAAGADTAWIELYEGTLPDLEDVPWDDWEGIDTSEYCDQLVDKAPMTVVTPTDIEIDYEGVLLENRSVAVMVGQTASIQARLRDSEGTWLGYDSMAVEADLSDGQLELTETVGGMFAIEALESGEPVDVQLGFEDLSANLTARPIDEVGAISTEVVRREDSRTEFEVFVAMTSPDGEIVLNPEFDAEVVSGPVDYLLQHPDRILVGTEDRTSLIRLMVTSPGAEHQFEVRSTASGEGEWADATNKVANQAANSCMVARTPAPPRSPGATLAILLLFFIARKVGRSVSRRPSRPGTRPR